MRDELYPDSEQGDDFNALSYARGVWRGLAIAIEYCDRNSEQHISHDRPWHADALSDAADHLKTILSQYHEQKKGPSQ